MSPKRPFYVWPKYITLLEWFQFAVNCAGIHWDLLAGKQAGCVPLSRPAGRARLPFVPALRLCPPAHSHLPGVPPVYTHSIKMPPQRGTRLHARANLWSCSSIQEAGLTSLGFDTENTPGLLHHLCVNGWLKSDCLTSCLLISAIFWSPGNATGRFLVVTVVGNLGFSRQVKV